MKALKIFGATFLSVLLGLIFFVITELSVFTLNFA